MKGQHNQCLLLLKNPSERSICVNVNLLIVSLPQLFKRWLTLSNHSAITCRVFTDLPKAITKPLKRIEINTPDIVISGVVKADVNLGGNKIINLSKPTQDNDAVNKDYADKLVHKTVVGSKITK